MTRIAIACQGGGSHTAFTAGVLEHVLPWIESHDAELVGLSGTSGGAVSAVAAWYGYQTGGADAAVDTLQELWADVPVSGPVERWVNASFVWWLKAQNDGAPVPSISPYQSPFAEVGKQEFVRTLERHVDFEAVPDLATPEAPDLVVGTVNVEAGDFETFTNEDVTAEAVLASAAVPSIFRAVEINGHGHWDGLFSQNPPIHDLMTVAAERKPEELWIVQINPQTTDDVPRTLEGIVDRRNELSGNISLNQELRWIERVNDWIDQGELSPERFTKTTVRRIILDETFSHGTKFDRSEAFIEELIEEGRQTATGFVDEIEADLHGHEHH